MNSPKDNNHKKALASAASAHGITPQRFAKDAYFPIDRYGERVAGAQCYDYWTTPDAALVAAAEAMGLEPDPILQQQEQTSAGMVMVPTADVTAVTSFLALFRGKEPSQVYDMADGARERLEQLITTFSALAPTEPASDLPTPDDLHRSISQARGLIQAAIGQTKDLDIPRCSKHLWEASRELGWAVQQITLALASTPDPQEGGAQP